MRTKCGSSRFYQQGSAEVIAEVNGISVAIVNELWRENALGIGIKSSDRVLTFTSTSYSLSKVG